MSVLYVRDESGKLVPIYTIKGEDGKTPYIQDGYWYIDGENTGVKATGAGVEESMLGEWVFNDEITPPTEALEIHFACNGKEYLVIEDDANDLFYSYEIEAFDAPVYNLLDNLWDTYYQTINILTEPSAEAAAWIKANAKRKQPVGVDKIKSIDTWWDTPYELEDNGDGIYWKNEFALLDEDGNKISSGEISQMVPLMAGENVTFERSADGIFFKINATGGGSGGADESMVGTWVFKDELSFENIDTGDSIYEIKFTCNSINYEIMYFMGEDITYWPSEGDGDGPNVYFNSGWEEQVYKTITILEEPASTEWVTWLKANATKQGGSNNGGFLPYKLPRIRFANFTEYINEEDMTMYRFTVENLGGGTLQVGDKLQICCKRKYPGGKKKLRQMAFYEITEKDINQRFLKIEVDPNDELTHKWLFKNDRIRYHTLSAMYFRLKRVTKYSDSDGKECDAIFSNVETVWKTFSMAVEEEGKIIYNLKIK